MLEPSDFFRKTTRFSAFDLRTSGFDRVEAMPISRRRLRGVNIIHDWTVKVTQDGQVHYIYALSGVKMTDTNAISSFCPDTRSF